MRTAITILELFDDGTVKKYSSNDYSIVLTPENVTNEMLQTLSGRHDLFKGSDNSKLYYELVEALGFSKTVKYTPKRAKQLRERLKSFQEADLLKAAKAIKNTPFMQGDNLQAKRYGTIDYLLRSDEIIDNYIQDGQDEIVLTNIEI